MTVLDSLFRRGSIYTLGLAVQLSSGVIAVPILTRLLAAPEFGEVAIGTVVLRLLATVAAAGLPAATLRRYFTGPHGSDESKALVTWTALVASVIVLGVHLTGPTWASVFSGTRYDAVLIVAVWAALPSAVLSSVLGLLRAREEAPRFVQLVAVNAIIGPVLGIGFVVAGFGPAGYIAGLLVGTLLAVAIGLSWTGVIPPWRYPAVVEYGFRIGGPTISHALAASFLNVGDRILIENLEGIAAVGRYQVGYVVGGLGISLVVAYNSAWAPIIYAARDPGRWRLLADTAAAVMRLAPLVVGMLAIGGPVALVVLAPPAYDPHELTAVNAIVSLSILPYVIYTANVLILFARERTGALLWAAPVAALLNVVLNLILIPSFGLAGAAAATLLAYTCLATIVKVIGRRMAAVSWESRAALKAWLLGGALCAAAILAPTSTGWLAVRGLVTGLLLVAVVHEARRLIAKERLATRTPVAASARAADHPETQDDDLLPG